MAEYSRFFGGPVGSIPEYTQPQFAEVLEKIFSDGVFTDILNELEVVETDPPGLAVKANSGEAWIQGFWYQNTAFLTKTLAAADVTHPRIDRLILRLDTVTNFKISLEVLTGTPGAVPVAPTLTQTASTYEISLAQVSVLANATSVNNANITNEREFVLVGNADTVDGVEAAAMNQLVVDQTIASVKIYDEGAVIHAPKTYTPDAAATATLDLSLGNNHEITMPAGNITIAISNETNGEYFTIDITQDGVGSRTVTWFTTIRWFPTAPTLTTTASKRDSFGFKCTGVDTYDGFIIGQGG